MTLAQTSVAGTPGAPYTVSASVSGPHREGGPDLRRATHDVRRVVQAVRDAQSARGWTDHEAWLFLRETPAQQRDSKVWRSGKVPQRYWDESVEGVPERFDSVQLTAPHWGEVRLQAPSLVHPGEPWREVRARLEAPEEGVADAARVMLAWLVEAVSTPGATHGFVHVDTVADPYGELVVGTSRFPAAGLAGRVEGYYWTLALGAEQVAALGGGAAVRDSGACEVVRPIDVGGEPGLLCQVTSDPADLTAAAVLAWRALLEPLLRPGIPGRLDDLSPGMPLARPVWLFEGPPAPALAASVLVHGSAPPPLTIEVAGEIPTSAALACSLTTSGTGGRDVVAAVEGAVGAWSRAARAGLLSGVGEPLAVTASPITAEDGDLRWRLTCTSAIPPAASSLLISALQVLHDELNRPGGVTPVGPALVRFSISPG